MIDLTCSSHTRPQQQESLSFDYIIPDATHHEIQINIINHKLLFKFFRKKKFKKTEENSNLKATFIEFTL